jgi:hypothetical protein
MATGHVYPFKTVDRPCKLCGRIYAAHSFDTRDTCNFYLGQDDDLQPTMPTSQGDTTGAGKVGVAPSNAAGKEDIRGPSPVKARFDNYRIRRIEAYNAFELLEKVIDNLGVEDGSQAPLPDMPLPVTPSDAHKNEMKNAATALLRMILIWNDGNVSRSGLQRW